MTAVTILHVASHIITAVGLLITAIVLLQLTKGVKKK